MNETITVQTVVNAPIEKVWDAYTDPEAVPKWNTPSEDWHTPRAENDLRVGGAFTYRMEAKDGSAGFDFGGTYTEVVLHERIAYTMTDGRTAIVSFTPLDTGVQVVVTFDPESENSHEMQRAGWQAILDSFKKYVEGAGV